MSATTFLRLLVGVVVGVASSTILAQQPRDEINSTASSHSNPPAGHHRRGTLLPALRQQQASSSELSPAVERRMTPAERQQIKQDIHHVCREVYPHQTTKP